MRFQEIIFQGVFDCRTPVRVEASAGVSATEFPSSVAPEDFHNLLISVIYPTQTPQAVRMAYASASNPKIALGFEHRQRRYRLLRQAEPESIRLQVDDGGTYRDLESGASQVEQFLRRNLELPDLAVCWNVNFWRFQDSMDSATRFDPELVDPEVRELIERYRLAHQVEALEDSIKWTESAISDRRASLGKGSSLEDKLRKAREKLEELEVSELSEEDLGLLERKDELLRDFDDQVTRLEAQEDSERQQVDLTLPDRPHRVPLFWAGLAIGFGALALSVVAPQWRAIALADAFGFGVCAWVLINYFSHMERASVHQVRLESIKRRLNQVREELVSTQERLNHILIHAGVRDAKELSERVHKTGRLREMIAKIEEQVEHLHRDPEYAQTREEVQKLEAKLDELRAQRAAMPDYVSSVFQLESDLRDLGVDPATALEDEAPSAQPDEADDSPLDRLLHAAATAGQWNGEKLYGKTRKMWAKICGHVLGERFADVSLEPAPRIRIGGLGPEQMEMWMRTRPSEYEIVLMALALAIEVNAADISKAGVLETLVISDPSRALNGAQMKKLVDVFKSATKRCNIIMCKSASE